MVWPTALAYHFYVSGLLPDAFFYLALLIVAEALDGIGKLGVYGAAEKSLVEPGLFDRIVRLVGGRRNIYVWVLIACVVLGMPEKALIVMAFWEAATAAVDLLHSCWMRYGFRRQSSSCPAVRSTTLCSRETRQDVGLVAIVLIFWISLSHQQRQQHLVYLDKRPRFLAEPFC